MALVRDGRWLKRYAGPGTEQDGYEPPDWEGSEQGGPTYGGRAEWLYVFHLEDEPETVDLLYVGEEEVSRLREELG